LSYISFSLSYYDRLNYTRTLGLVLLFLNIYLFLSWCVYSLAFGTEVPSPAFYLSHIGSKVQCRTPFTCAGIHMEFVGEVSH